MSKAKTNKILITVLCFCMVVSMSIAVLANGVSIDGVTIDPKTTSNAATKAGTVANTIIGMIKVVGIIISVGCLMVLGIKYMVGSAEEKAEYKKVFIPYIIGAVLLFAASTFAQQLYNWANDLFK